MTGVHVRWASGGEAHILSIGTYAIGMRSTVPAPPGSRLEGTVSADGVGITVRVKVHSCRREGDGGFVLWGRPLDLTREVRRRLEEMVQPSTHLGARSDR